MPSNNTPSDSTSPNAKTPVTFKDLGLDERLLRALTDLGFDKPTPIQEQAIPLFLQGRDVIGSARTGSGKTLAFGLPLLQRVSELGRGVKALILAPTRELALQVSDALSEAARHMPVDVFTIYGGTAYGPQFRALKSGVPVIVGTPGRILDHIERGTLDLSGVEVVVLDEADEMLRMGFIDDVEAILGETPPERQVALFSATMPGPIQHIAQAHLSSPVDVSIGGDGPTVDHIEQRWMRVPNQHKPEALLRVLQGEARGTTLVFAKTRRTCADAADYLVRHGFNADALHGELSQSARERVTNRLRSGGTDVLVATDVAARGLDVDHVTHVINLDLPADPESYVHRIGRTGRAGRAGVAISFVTPTEKRRMRGFERELDADVAQVEVPTDADIAKLQRNSLRDALSEALESDDDAQTWLEETLSETGWTPAEVAVAAVRLLASDRKLSLETVTEPESPQWFRKVDDSRSQDDPLVGADMVEIFLPVGKNQRVRPGDIVGAITGDCGIKGNQVGRITVSARVSFVELPREVAERVVNDHSTISIRGMDVFMDLARPRNGDGGGHSDRPHNDRGPDRRGARPPGNKPPHRGKKPFVKGPRGKKTRR